MRVPASSVRAFVGLPSPPRLGLAMAAVMTGWRRLSPTVRWTDPERAHLTVRFLGQVPPERLERLDSALRGVAAGKAPVRLMPAATGAFPGWGRPRVLWLGFVPDEALAGLAMEVEEASRQAGFEPEERAFRAHLTLGRAAGGPAARPAAAAVRAWEPGTGAETVAEMILYRSDPGAGKGAGPRHTPLAHYLLAARDL